MQIAKAFTKFPASTLLAALAACAPPLAAPPGPAVDPGPVAATVTAPGPDLRIRGGGVAREDDPFSQLDAFASATDELVFEERFWAAAPPDEVRRALVDGLFEGLCDETPTGRLCPDASVVVRLVDYGVVVEEGGGAARFRMRGRLDLASTTGALRYGRTCSPDLGRDAAARQVLAAVDRRSTADLPPDEALRQAFTALGRACGATWGLEAREQLGLHSPVPAPPPAPAQELPTEPMALSRL